MRHKRPPAQYAPGFQRCPSFTLIELLITLAILGVLAGIILPVVTAGRERGKLARCMSNVRQLHLAFSLYAQDHNGFLPPYQNGMYRRVGVEGGPSAPVPEHGEQLVRVLNPYIRSEGIWFCPRDPFARTDSTEGFIRHQFSSYRVNVSLGLTTVTGDTPDADGPSFLSRVFRQSNAAEIALLTDGLWPDDPSPDAVEPLYSHQGRFVVLYLDGHAATCARSGMPHL